MAPSTLGTFLRSFTFGNVRQLDRASEQALTGAWAAGAGPGTGFVHSQACPTASIKFGTIADLKLQADQGTDPAYSIRTFTVVSAERATTVFSSSLRRLIAVAALCGISTVGAVTLAETLSVWRRGDRSPRARPHRAQRPGERSRRQRDAAASEPDQRRAHGTGGEPSAIEAP